MTVRNPTADLLKGVAVLLMIQVHIVELFAGNSILYSSFGRVALFLGGPPVAPVFMLIFGYFIAASEKTQKQLILRGLKIFGVGMALNLALNFNLILSVSRGLYTVDLLPYILGVDILQFAGISLIMISILKRIFEKSLPLIMVLILLAALTGPLLQEFVPGNIVFTYVSAFFYGSSKWSYFPLFPWISYPLSGFLFYRLRQLYGLERVNKIKIPLIILFPVFLVCTIRYAISVSSDLPSYYHHGIVFYGWVIVFIALYSFLMNDMKRLLRNTQLARYLEWMGRNVTMIYIIQWIIIGNVATEIYRTVTSPLYLLVSFFLVLLVSCLATYLLLKIRQRYAGR